MKPDAHIDDTLVISREAESLSELLASAQKKEAAGKLDESSFDQLNALTKEFGSFAQPRKNLDPQPVEPFESH